MQKYSLHVSIRDIKKHALPAIRREGKVPGTLYGRSMKSMSILVDVKAFMSVYAEARETGLVDISVDGTVRPALIHHVQKDPVSGRILHIEFHQVDLKEKIKAEIPLVFVGESPAVQQKVGVLLSVLSAVEVEALPTELPDKIEVDISGLSEIEQELTVARLHVPSGVQLLTDPTLVVAKIGALVSKEAEAQATADAQKAQQAATEGQAEAGAETGEATKTEEKSADASPAE